MGILIDGRKVFEDDQIVTYAFVSGGRSGEVSIDKAQFLAQLSTPDLGLDPAGMKILMKAYKHAEATGLWPEKVLYAA